MSLVRLGQKPIFSSVLYRFSGLTVVKAAWMSAKSAPKTLTLGHQFPVQMMKLRRALVVDL